MGINSADQKSKAVRYSILVATMNRPDAIAKMLDSVEKQTFLPQEFILVDQSKDDRTKEICDAYAIRIAARGQTFKYVRQEVPSLVKARNRGLEESTGDIICYIDDDVILNADYFERVVSYFKDPKVGGVSGNVFVEHEQAGFKWEVRKLLMRLFLLSNYQGRLTLSTFGFPIYERAITKVMPVELFPGYSMNYRREFVLRNRPDEWFSGYGFREDVDLSYRISRDAKLFMVPDAKFIHDVSLVNRLDVKKLKKMQFKNYVYLFKKFRKFGIFTWPFFLYSLAGIIVIDFLELLFNWDKNRWEVFTANFPAIAGMWSLHNDKN